MIWHRTTRRLLAAAAGGIAVSAASAASAATTTPVVSAYLAQHAAAEKSGATFRPITEMSPGFSQAEAYQVQHAIVARHRRDGDRVVGYKGSLMSQKSLTDRGVKDPLTGALFASGIVQSGGVVSLCGYRRPIFEMKLGYTFAKPVTKKVASVADLKGLVTSVEAVVEIPDIAYRDDKTYGAVDMVAANITAAKFVTGKAQPPANTDLNDIEATLSRGGQLLTSGKGRESLGDQWTSLLTVVNLAIGNGFKIEPGYVFLSGKIGDKPVAESGSHVADFGPIGSVRFDVKPCTGS